MTVIVVVLLLLYGDRLYAKSVTSSDEKETFHFPDNAHLPKNVTQLNTQRIVFGSEDPTSNTVSNNKKTISYS